MLEIEFSPYWAFSDADGRHPPLSTRPVLPALTRFTFRGEGDHLNILMAHLDTPLLNRLSVTFLDSAHIHIYTTQLAQFIGHAPRFRAIEEASIFFSDNAITVKLASRAIGHEGPLYQSNPRGLFQLWPHIAPSFPPLFTLERLYISEIGDVDARLQQVINRTQWLEILRPFTAVKSLYISKLLAPQIMSDLQEFVGRGMVEVLPILQNIFIEGLQLSRPVQELFDAVRQSGRPINVSYWNKLKDLEQDNF